MLVVLWYERICVAMNFMWIKSMDEDPVSREVYFSSGFAIETA